MSDKAYWLAENQQPTTQDGRKSEASPGCCCSPVGGSAGGKPAAAAAAGPSRAGSAGTEGREVAALSACCWCPV